MWWWLHDSVNILKITKFYTEKWVLLYVNYMSKKLLLKKKIELVIVKWETLIISSWFFPSMGKASIDVIILAPLCLQLIPKGEKWLNLSEFGIKNWYVQFCTLVSSWRWRSAYFSMSVSLQHQVFCLFLHVYFSTASGTASEGWLAGLILGSILGSTPSHRHKPLRPTSVLSIIRPLF